MISDLLEEVTSFNLVYRDIKERGRNIEKVIGRYHKFVKPAFDEYIKPVN
jgi:uridine kinase